MRRLLQLAAMAVVLTSFVPVPAQADTTDALQRLAVSFAKLQSFHATMQSGPMNADMDYVAPDRYHLIMHSGHDIEEMIIGETVYAKLGSQWMKFPMPGVTQMIAHFRQPEAVAKTIDTSKITDMGMTQLNGTPAHQYGVDSGDGSTHTVMWIGPHDLPLRIDAEELSNKRVTTILYSEFNAPITIEAPI
ncbi:MAG TPA: hypothetical protein VME66_03705 [Candidatus Acidoferrales bacterium]|nr:hypothetical protein [Candidatus Acidoferrales bacterium]